MELRFAPSESTFEYFASVRRYLQRHGRPGAFYSDKASIFRVNKKEVSADSLTQFGRAMKDLNIDIICAHSAPAKGRVERAHLALQDRLVKVLRLAGISTMDEAQGFLDGFVEDYNRRFGRVPQSPQDAHRPLLEDMALDDIFKLQEERKVSRNLTLNYKRTLYVLEPTPELQDLKGKRVQVYENDDGQVSIRDPDGRELAARPFSKAPRATVQPGDIVENKLLGGVLSFIRDHQLEEDEKRLETARTQRERRLARKRLRKASG